MFINVLTQVIILLLLILTGFVLTKGKVLTENGVKSMTDMVLLLVTPCVIIKSFIREFDKDVLKSLLISFLIAILVHIGFILVSLLIKADAKAKQKVLQFGVIFSNCGYMSIPLQQALLGDTGVFYGSSFIAIFNIFVWSYGIILMSGDKKYLSPKKLIINPGMIGIVIGLIIFLFSIPVPKILSEPVSYLASLNTPLPMIIIGYHLAHSSLLNGIKSLKCIIAIAMKLVILPAAALGIMYLCGIRGTMLISSVISCSAPSAAITTMFSSKFGADTDMSVNMVSLSTVLSLLTMPLLITLTQYIA
ncbi:MAG: AEC family transporter [Clostridia bacterium]|nr:AEC family transporter [Clostridia bacterium]